jgi:hypothetical protein
VNLLPTKTIPTAEAPALLTTERENLYVYPIKKEDKPNSVRVLETLRSRLQDKYELAAGRQTVGSKPSGHMCGLKEALQEVDQLIQERAGWKTSPPRMYMSVLESQTDMGNGIILQSWFTRLGADIIRTELYSLEDGSVVAFQDCVNGVNEPLHMDSIFKAMYEDEFAFGTILHYSGVLDPGKIELYYTGR